jgi:hypothetical protein
VICCVYIVFVFVMAELSLISKVLSLQPFLHLYVIPCMLLSTVVSKVFHLLFVG